MNRTRVLHSRGSGRRPWLLAALAACATGCATAGEERQMGLDAGATESGPEVSVEVKAVPAALVAAALDDAARRTSVARAEIEVVTAAAVTWSDGSLGCPEPGMGYTQALVPGYRLELRAGRERLLYHAGRDARPSFCPASRALPPSSVPSVD